MTIAAWGGSKQGHGRQQNQDAWAMDQARGLFILCDGMGGHAEGGRAAREVIAAMLEPAEDADRTRAQNPSLRLKQRVTAAHSDLIALASKIGHKGDMGCTLVHLAIRGGVYLLANVGDSRCWLLRDGKLIQVSEDHTVVAGYVRDGIIEAEEAETHPQRNLLTQAMGMNSVDPDVFEGAVQPGDRFLMTSDGVHGVIKSTELEAILAKAPGPRRCGEAILKLVQDRQGDDDATVVLVFVEE